MTQGSTKLTIRLQSSIVAFAKQYARDHGITVTEVIDRYLRQMRDLQGYSASSRQEPFTGLIPDNIDAEAEFRGHSLRKHQT